jgi:tetratricopeptide (TPR) repeat protein
LGEIHVAIQEYENAIKYFTNAFAIVDGNANAIATLRYHNGLGGCYLKMKDYAKSEFHLTKSLEVKDLPPTIISRVENDLGELYLETKEYDKAERLLSSSLAVREANKLEDAACTSMTSLAEVYLRQNRISEALQLLDRCLGLVEKYQTKLKKVRVLSLMARAHGLSENYEEATRYYEQHQLLYDSVKSESERNIFKFKNAQIEKQKKIISDKHKQLAVTVEEIKRLKVNRKAAIFSWITIIILVVISELFLDPFIDNYAYNNLLSLLVKVMIALLFKPIDGLYEKILWQRAIKKPEEVESYQ